MGCPAIRAWTRASDAARPGAGAVPDHGAGDRRVRRDALRRQELGSQRRVIMKAEVVQYPGRAPRDNPRFVVSNLTLAPEASTRSTASEGTSRIATGAQGQPGLGAPAAAFSGQPVRVLLTATPTSCSRRCSSTPGHGLRGPRSPPCGSVSSSSRCGSPDRRAAGAAPATRLSLAGRLAPARAGGRGSGRLIAPRLPGRVHDRGSGYRRAAVTDGLRPATGPRSAPACFLAASTSAVVRCDRGVPRAVRLRRGARDRSG